MFVELNIREILTYLIFMLIFDVGGYFQRDDQPNAIKYYLNSKITL